MSATHQLSTGAAGAAARLGGIMRGMRQRGGVPRIVPRIVEIGFVLLIAWLAVRFVYSFTPVAAPLPEMIDTSAGTGPALSVDTSVFDRFDPFAARAVSAAAPVQVEAAETDLDIDLSGIWADGDGTGIAIIKMGNRGQKMYRVGDEIMNGVVLDRLEADRAIIRRAGRLESVTLSGRRAPGNTLMATAGTRPMATPDTMSERPGSERPGYDMPGYDMPAAELPALSTNTTDSEPFDPYAGGNSDTAMSQLTDSIALQPVRQNGAITGYEVAPRGDYAIFRALGFRPGDQIREIGGQPVPATPQGFADLLQSLQGQQEVEVILDREGDGVTLTLNPGDL